MNEDFISLDTVSFMDDVLAFFDSHGSRDQQIRANYAMGCVYRDRGNSPMALEYYLKAVNLADTTAKDCNFQKLSRIYGQMSVIYSQQRYPQAELETLMKSLNMAEKAKDSMMYYQCIGLISDAYYVKGDWEKALYYNKEAYKGYKLLKRDDYAASTLGFRILYYLRKDSVELVKKYIDEYINKADMLDENGDFYSGNELFYCYIGRYNEKISELDSALYYYRKALNKTKDIEIRESVFKDLMSVYGKKQMLDSVTKYAYLYADANDSANIQNSAKEVSRTKALYDYSDYHNIALEKTKEAKNLWILILSSFIVLIAISIVIFLYFKHHKRKTLLRLSEANRLYFDTLEKYILSKRELNKFKDDYIQFEIEKKNEIKKLQDLLSNFQGIEANEDWDSEQCIHLHENVKRMHKLASSIITPNEADWQKLSFVVKTFMPDFYNHIENSDIHLSEKERRVCFLARLCFSPSEMVILMDMSSQNITNIRSRLNIKLFKEKGSKTFNRNIQNF